ncbi:MAG: ribonuclease H-like YkuK family protein [Saprospiraceae bacterium]
MGWNRLNGQKIELPIKEAVENTILAELAKGYRLKICVGTDSAAYHEQIEFATVIVFIREKRGGFMFVQNEKVKKKMSLKERMIVEVGKSVDIAYHICELLDRYDVELEVHADINADPNFQSNVAFKEAMGYILGMGFTFKSKPDAFASSSCADKLL